MRVYLDNCCFNRPFDDQGQIRIRLETEAKLYVQSKIVSGNLDLVWSFILDFENAANPFDIRRATIQRWKSKAVQVVLSTENLMERARLLANLKFRSKDALHIACALEAGCQYFLTTDDGIIAKRNQVKEIVILSPVEMLSLIEIYEN